MGEILDIFPKIKDDKKPKIIEREKIIADYRERNSLVYSNLIKLGLDVEFKELKVADYIFKDVAIERKTVSDFISSTIDKRIFHQLEEIKQYPNHLLIIEGIEEQELYDDSKSEGIKSNAIRGLLLSIVLKYKIPIIFTKNAEDTASFIYVLSRKTNNEMSLNPKKKTRNPEEQKQYILVGFPGIGPKTAKKLLKEFKSIKNITNASLEDLRKSIGKKADIFKLVD
ncbi:MAG: ERCC4 domain-containing protein [Nanoarchaeota archaeon]|nr:ERCC4 domain-containing protein [Nanoarchaeota archaeon]